MLKLNTPHTIFPREHAAKLAAELNEDEEDDWVYVVENNPNPDGLKTAIVNIHDEDGELVGRL